MPWVRLDENFSDHPKVQRIAEWERPLAVYLHLMALCWSSRQLTDGWIPKTGINRLAPELLDYDPDGSGRVTPTAMATLLVAAGLWEDHGDRYRIHDYLEYQPSRDQVVATRAVRQEAGRQGGLASAHSKRQANGKQTASNVLSKPTSKTEAKFNPDPDPQDQDQEDHRPAGAGQIPHLWKTQKSGLRRSALTGAHARAPDENPAVLVRLAHEVLETNPETDADAADLLKTLASKARIGYPNGRAIASALEQAARQRRKTQEGVA